MAKPSRGQAPSDERMTEKDWRDRGTRMLQTTSGIGVACLTGYAMIYIVDPGQSDFMTNMKRVAATAAITLANMGTMRLCVTKGAELAAAGSEIAKAAVLASVGVLVPLNATIGYLGLAAPQVPVLEARETCAEIRNQAAAFDQTAVGQGLVIRTIDGQEVLFARRYKEESEKGRGTGKPSAAKRPEPIAYLWADAQSAAAEARGQFAKGDVDRVAKVKQIQQIAEECEKTVRDPKRWSKNGASFVIGAYDRASILTRELAATTPVNVVQGLADTYRSIGKSLIGNTDATEVRSVLAAQAARLEKEIAAMPRAPDPMPALPATSVISAAFDAERLKALWPLALLATTIELGGPLAILMAYVIYRRRFEDRRRRDEDDTDGGKDGA